MEQRHPAGVNLQLLARLTIDDRQRDRAPSEAKLDGREAMQRRVRNGDPWRCSNRRTFDSRTPSLSFCSRNGRCSTHARQASPCSRGDAPLSSVMTAASASSVSDAAPPASASPHASAARTYRRTVFGSNPTRAAIRFLPAPDKLHGTRTCCSRQVNRDGSIRETLLQGNPGKLRQVVDDAPLRTRRA